MTCQPWTTSKLAAERTADLQRLARPRPPTRSTGRQRGTSAVALGAARLLVAAGFRLGGTKALPASLRRRLA